MAALAAVADKVVAQQALLQAAKAHADMQRKVADTTAAMMAAKQQALALETRRHGAAQKVLAKLTGAEGGVVETLDAARARKEARQAQPVQAVWRSR
jgi:hypothetical protein